MAEDSDTQSRQAFARIINAVREVEADFFEQLQQADDQARNFEDQAKQLRLRIEELEAELEQLRKQHG